MAPEKCGEDDADMEEEHSTEDMAFNADCKVDALINLLLKKKIITEEEFGREYDDLFEESDEEEE